MKTHCFALLRTFSFTLLLAAVAIASEGKFDLPSNLQPSSELLPTLEKMWLRSPTFRRTNNHSGKVQSHAATRMRRQNE